MLSALLGALSATVLAFAPALVEPSSNLSNNDGDITSVRSAYYEAGGAYGTTAGNFYNYSSYTLQGVEAQTGANVPTMPPDDSGTYFVMASFDGTNYGIKSNGISSSTDLDIYVDGVFYTNNLISRFGTYYISFQEEPTGYIWAFDHSEAPAYQLGTDTVADIAEGLTSGIGTVATGIGGGLGSLMQNIFLVGTVDDETGAFTATGLSTFGIVTVAFCGLALALGLSRWVVGFASSLGSRNR